ncbi:hypothetical protein LH128_05223 [Sphingomonas sp. LH128]|uniref:DUF6950 family protein n=1 Tax=Sphingomonas sp. LH128 TaxID=473781 RepID=UPI00027C9B20|nr:hypothetical protein [Sphingomonas sp. LH128]EJU14133.1 hypothetical protein LH128_05223 [Sphingomonas sp. LH128]
MDLVDETLRDWRRHPHQYGVNDCVLSAAAYFMALGVTDRMPWFAGTYADSDEAMVVLAELGGMERAIEIVGGTAVEGEPQRGDLIGLMADADYVIPALCTGDGVAVRLERGLIELRLKFVQWRGVWRGIR